jgi:hypothetical protein
MTQDEPQMPADLLELRIFTIADHAVVAPDGKLYMNGGGVDRLFMQSFPGATTPLSLVIRFRVPWGMTSQPIPFEVRLLDADRNSIIPGPLAGGNLEVGRVPGQRPGDELAAMVAFNFAGVPIANEGTVFFHLSVDHKELAVLPLKIERPPGS